MKTMQDLTHIIAAFAPYEFAMPGDKLGLIVGDPKAEVEGVLVCVDITREVLEYARRIKCNAIVSHHPLIFNPVEKLVCGERVADLCIEAVRGGSNLIAAHTNMDFCPSGINVEWARRLGLNEIYALPDFQGYCGEAPGGVIDSEMLLCETRSISQNDNARFYGKRTSVRRIAISCGAGGRDAELLTVCMANNVDAVISGEWKHSVVLSLIHAGIAVIDAGHYDTETIFIDIMYRMLDERLHDAIPNRIHRYTVPIV